MKINKIWWWFSLFTTFVFLSGCETKIGSSKIYPIDSVVSAQITLLTASKARLQKNAFIGGKKSERAYTPADTIAWNNELNIFRQLDVMNKPINRGKYIVDDGLFDPGSNLTVKAFSAIAELPVRYIRIFYQDSVDRPRKIEALFHDENSLSKTGRVLTMEFQQFSNQSMLTGYSIDGGQKMIFGDTVSFSIKGKILID